MKEKYLLLMDPREDYLHLQESVLRCLYPGEVLSLTDVGKAQEALRAKGKPELIIVDSSIVFADDSHFYRHLEDEKVGAPLIATAQFPLPDTILTSFPSIRAVVNKPLTVATLADMVRDYSSKTSNLPQYIPVKLSLMARLGEVKFDLYMKLSATNFVKIFNQGESLSEEDLAKLTHKGVTDLYILSSRSQEFLNLLETTILGLGQERSVDSLFALQNIEAFEKVARAMKWTPEVLDSAQKSVKEAVRILSKNKKVFNILKMRVNDPASTYSRHIGLLTYLVSAMGAGLEWVGEQGQVKLALAALMHDMAVSESSYESIKDWNRRSRDRNDKSPEIVRYRMHPFDAMKLLSTLSELPPDVDQIILQHHEVKDGSGFPRGISASRIHPLASVFIMAEDLIDFLEEGESVETSIKDFITWGRFFYDSGHFMKIFSVLEEMLDH